MHLAASGLAIEVAEANCSAQRYAVFYIITKAPAVCNIFKRFGHWAKGKVRKIYPGSLFCHAVVTRDMIIRNKTSGFLTEGRFASAGFKSMISFHKDKEKSKGGGVV